MCGKRVPTVLRMQYLSCVFPAVTLKMVDWNVTMQRWVHYIMRNVQRYFSVDECDGIFFSGAVVILVTENYISIRSGRIQNFILGGEILR